VLSLLTLPRLLKAAPWIVAGLALLGVVLWVRGMQATITKQRGQINELAVNLKAEQSARQRDIAGLTTLATGLAKVATDNKRDSSILAETIDRANPAPSSDQLRKFLNSLREADRGGR
jgi:hypothetical protein